MTAHLRRIDSLDPQLRRKWAAARVWTARQAPYLASAVLALEPVVVESAEGRPGQSREFDLRAFPVDAAWQVYLDAETLDATEVPEIGFWLLHQVTHLLRHHADRFPDAGRRPLTAEPLRGRDSAQVRWNTACDAEIDDDLHTAALIIPKHAVTPRSLMLPDGWLAEQYWEHLDRSYRDPPDGAPDSASDDHANSASPSDAAPAASSADSSPAPGSYDCGSGCDGVQRPWDCPSGGLSAAGRRLLAIDVARRVREHSRARRDVPEGWRRWAEDELEPVVDWRRVLRAAVRRGLAEVTGRVDFTYRRPSRRAAALPGVVLPSMRQPRPAVAVVVDTSGSMNDAMLGQVLGEVSGLLAGLGVGRDRLHVLCCDAQAYAAQRVFSTREVRLLGGGGTDMGAGIDAAAKLRPRPDLIVVLTDGHTPWPAAAPPAAKVVVGLLDPTGTTPQWATSVTVDAGLAANGAGGGTSR